jgi:hypothetical protein
MRSTRRRSRRGGKNSDFISRIKTSYQTANIKRNQSLARRARERSERKYWRVKKDVVRERTIYYKFNKLSRRIGRGLRRDKNGFDSSDTSPFYLPNPLNMIFLRN